jgi:glycosyltransferase involved in cell wall biosynthesis|nr:glycosyltransferase [uncultured Albidiferax sp.]
MKVLHVYRTYFPDPPGGLQEAIRQICLATGSFGVESKVFTLSPQPLPKRLVRPEAVTVRSLSWAAPASCDLGGADSVREFYRLQKWADVVHLHFPWPFADVLNLFKASDKPAVMTYHSDIVRQQVLNRLYGPLMRRTMRAMSAVIATSPAYAKSSPVLKRDVPSGRLRTIPLGIVDKPEAAAGFAGQSAGGDYGVHQPFVLALGVLRYYKGLHTLVHAARQISGNIVIAGSGPEDANLKELAKQLGVTNIFFAGQVTDAQKTELLHQCTALVLPSHLRSEAFGMVLVEAAMFSKPMVCCEVGSGTSYVNLDGVTGWVVPPESPSELANACNRIFEDPVLAKAMGMAARARYEDLFSGVALGRAYSDLYREVKRAPLSR